LFQYFLISTDKLLQPAKYLEINMLNYITKPLYSHAIK